jgi:hypothetical protein
MLLFSSFHVFSVWLWFWLLLSWCNCCIFYVLVGTLSSLKLLQVSKLLYSTLWPEYLITVLLPDWWSIVNICACCRNLIISLTSSAACIWNPDHIPLQDSIMPIFWRVQLQPMVISYNPVSAHSSLLNSGSYLGIPGLPAPSGTLDMLTMDVSRTALPPAAAQYMITMHALVSPHSYNNKSSM